MVALTALVFGLKGNGMIKTCLAFLVVVTLGGQGFAEVKDYGSVSTFQVRSQHKLSSGARKSFSKFKAGWGHFGAFFYNPTTGADGWTTAMTSLSAAINIAKFDCEFWSKGQGECVLHSLAVPKGFPPDVQKATGLTKGQSKGLRQWSRDQTKGYAAFVISDNGDYGWSLGFTSKEVAVKNATLQCNSSAAATLADTPTHLQNYIEKRDWANCSVFRLEER